MTSDFALQVPAELETALQLKTVQYLVTKRPWLDLYGVNVRPVAPYGSASRRVNVDPALIHRCLPDELLFEVFSRMAPYDMGRAACVCRKWRYTLRNPIFWRNACLKAWQASIYVSRNTYIRAGVREWKVTNPVHLVCYYRYMRFFPSGRFLYKTSGQTVKEVVKCMNFRASKTEGVFSGRYTLTDDKVEATFMYPGLRPTMWRAFLRLRGTTLGANNRLDLLSLSTSKVNSDGMIELEEDILGSVELQEDVISHQRGLAPFAFVPFEEVETSVLNLPVEKMDYYVPG
ncbi:hypothetical protein DKX38_002383 [Salix brachista]|uniref:F-box protein n=1 Tax=Salix brachista TaxID=2182728 RepID=A0A5N5NLY4_9ROSI|nr:hypothetical protein DKX38_002383 [Salix brachista]